MPPASGPRNVKTRKVKVKAHTRQIAVADTKSAADLHRASDFARTPRYRKAIRDAYSAAPVARRHEILTHASPTIQRAVSGLHAQRVARDRQIASSQARHDVPGADLQRTARYLLAHPDILKKPAGHRGFLAGILHSVYGGGGSGSGGSKTAAIHYPSVPMVSKGLPVQAAINVGEVIASDPKQIPRLAVDTGKSLVGAPAGILDIALHPRRGIARIGADYAHRYGPLLRGDSQTFRKQVKQEGIAPEVYDLSALASAGGATLGRVAQKAGEAGQLGRTVQRIATTPRKAIQVSGSTATRAPLSKNLLRNVAAHSLEQLRLKNQNRRLRHEETPAHVREAARQGNVTLIRNRASVRLQHRMVARDKGIERTRMLGEQHQEVHAGAHRQLASLSKREQAAFAYAMKLGIPVEKPALALASLKAHRELILRERAAQPGLHISRKTDELPVIEDLIAHPEAFSGRVGEVVKSERSRAERVALGDPGVAATQAQLRRYAPQAEHMGVVRGQSETTAQFLRRVKATARDRGLARPGYFPSEKRPQNVFSAFALGGSRAVMAPKAYTGALFRTGRESVSPQTFERGIAQNIKRKYNWNYVADNFDKHVLEWSKNSTIDALQTELERRGIDPRTVAFWNPRRYRAERQAHVGEGGLEPDITDNVGDEAIHGAFKASTLPALSTIPADFKGTTGWSVIPKGIHDEIATELKPSTAAARIYDIAKGKTSRVLLANPAWLQYQIGANALLTGLSGTGPIDAVKAQLWWKKLSPAQRQAIEPYLGIMRWHDQQTHLGAASTSSMVNAWRAFKQTKLYASAHKANPLDAIFKADNAQNNFFRRAVFYNQIKKTAYKNMGRSAHEIIPLQRRMAHILTLGPERQMKAAIDDLATFEHHAQKTVDFLGDYTTYTARERRLISRSVMFYGFLRYSVKFAFYTMPVGHPIMSSMLLQLGRLHRDELQRIFGTDVPVWELGNYYSPDGSSRVQVSRLNPFVNATQYIDLSKASVVQPQAVIAFLPPFIQAALDSAAGKNIAFDKPFTVDHSAAYVTHASDVTPGQRARILLGDLLHLSPIERTAEKAGIPGISRPLVGKQTDTSSLLFPSEVRYKANSKTSRARQAANQRDIAGTPTGLAAVREQMLPVLGQSAGPIIRKSRQYAKDQSKAKKKPRRHKDPYGFSGGSTGNPYGF